MLLLALLLNLLLLARLDILLALRQKLVTVAVCGMLYNAVRLDRVLAASFDAELLL